MRCKYFITYITLRHYDFTTITKIYHFATFKIQDMTYITSEPYNLKTLKNEHTI